MAAYTFEAMVAYTFHSSPASNSLLLPFRMQDGITRSIQPLNASQVWEATEVILNAWKDYQPTKDERMSHVSVHGWKSILGSFQVASAHCMHGPSRPKRNLHQPSCMVYHRSFMDCHDKQHGCCHKKSSSLRRNHDCFDVVEIAWFLKVPLVVFCFIDSICSIYCFHCSIF